MAARVKRYEYAVCLISGARDDVQKQMNGMAALGWKLHSVASSGTVAGGIQVECIFERQTTAKMPQQTSGTEANDETSV